MIWNPPKICLSGSSNNFILKKQHSSSALGYVMKQGYSPCSLQLARVLGFSFCSFGRKWGSETAESTWLPLSLSFCTWGHWASPFLPNNKDLENLLIWTLHHLNKLERDNLEPKSIDNPSAISTVTVVTVNKTPSEVTLFLDKHKTTLIANNETLYALYWDNL